MAKINTMNYQAVTAWNGTQDLFVVEQPDGTKVATLAQLKQYVETGDFEATGEIIDGHGNILKDMAKSADLILEKFTPTLAAAVETPRYYEHNCFYNPKTKEVHIQVMIYSIDGLIPTNSRTIFTVADKYRPAENIQLGMAFVVSSAQWDSRVTRMEKCFLGANGAFGLNNFIYGEQATKVLYIAADYIAK